VAGEGGDVSEGGDVKCPKTAELVKVLMAGAAAATEDVIVLTDHAAPWLDGKGAACPPCNRTLDQAAGFQRWYWKRQTPHEHRDAEAIQARIDEHALYCTDCCVHTNEQGDGSILPSFHCCHVASALIDALDTFNRTLAGTLYAIRSVTEHEFPA
jgi:hypothetical protein